MSKTRLHGRGILTTRRELWAETCRKSFWEFFRHAYGAHNNPGLRRWLTPRIHKPLCDWLQQHTEEWLAQRRALFNAPKPGVFSTYQPDAKWEPPERKIRHLLVVVPRNFGKTTIVTQAWQIWLHLQDPDICTYIGSENLSKSQIFFDPIKAVLSGSDPYARFTELYGSWYDPKRAWTTEKAVHAARKAISRKEPSFGIWGVESGLTGYHPDVLILDDPTSYEKMAAITNWLQYVNDHVDALTPVINPDGMMVFVGTRYHDGDHIGRAMRNGGIATVTGMKPPGVSVRPDGKWHLYFMAARDANNRPVFPEVWSEQRMAEWERDKNAYYWAQVMNDPGSSEFNPLSREKVASCLVDREEVPKLLRYTIHMDTAFFHENRRTRGDESVIQVWGHARDGSGEVYFIEGHGSNLWTSEQFLTRLIEICRRYRQMGRRISAMTDEREVGGKEGSYETLLRQAFLSADVRMPRMEWLTRGITRKIKRIREAASYYTEGYVRIVRDAPGAGRLIDQLIRIGTSDHDDWVDAAADVFHPRVYMPMQRGELGAQPPEPELPTDRVLKGRGPTTEEALRMYDRHFEPDEGYEPIR